MALIVGIVSQKGGVGKSTIARLVAREYAAANWNCKIADLDVSQATSFQWQARRLQSGLEPVIAVERFGNIAPLLRIAAHYDLVIVDAPPHSSAATLKIAEACDGIILPTGLAVDDLQPQILLAHELVQKGIGRGKITFVLCRVGDSPAEISEARAYIGQAGYSALAGEIPERTAYRRASDQGRALTETPFPSLNHRADELAQSIVDHLTKLQKKRKAAHG